MDLDALETSFDLVAPRGDELMEIFYARPVRGRAGGASRCSPARDMARQRAMLLSALVLLRKSLRDLDARRARRCKQARRPPRRLRRRSPSTTRSSARC